MVKKFDADYVLAWLMIYANKCGMVEHPGFFREVENSPGVPTYGDLAQQTDVAMEEVSRRFFSHAAG